MTEIVCILDRSGSMGSVAEEVIGAFNHFVAEQKKLPDEAWLTLVLFDDTYEVVHNRVPIQEVPALDGSTYFVRGWTALYDAIGKGINTIDGAPSAIVIIQTDGQENASKEYTRQQIKDLITAKEAIGWEFRFVGAGIDAFAAGNNIGIQRGQTLQVTQDAAGYQAMSAAMVGDTIAYRTRPKNKPTS